MSLQYVEATVEKGAIMSGLCTSALTATNCISGAGSSDPGGEISAAAAATRCFLSGTSSNVQEQLLIAGPRHNSVPLAHVTQQKSDAFAYRKKEA